MIWDLFRFGGARNTFNVGRPTDQGRKYYRTPAKARVSSIFFFNIDHVDPQYTEATRGISHESRCRCSSSRVQLKRENMTLVTEKYRRNNIPSRCKTATTSWRGCISDRQDKLVPEPFDTVTDIIARFTDERSELEKGYTETCPLMPLVSKIPELPNIRLKVQG